MTTPRGTLEGYPLKGTVHEGTFGLRAEGLQCNANVLVLLLFTVRFSRAVRCVGGAHLDALSPGRAKAWHLSLATARNPDYSDLYYTCSDIPICLQTSS